MIKLKPMIMRPLDVPHPEVMHGKQWNLTAKEKSEYIQRYIYSAKRGMEKYDEGTERWQKHADDLDYWRYEYEWFKQWIDTVEKE